MESAENNNTATSEASAGDGFTSNGGESKIDTNNNINSMMDWEMANADDTHEKKYNVVPSCTASIIIVSNVPAGQAEAATELGVVNDDMDVDSFSFGSESGDDREEAKATSNPEPASSFDIKVLQAVVEASAHALDIVTGKDVVMVAGKTGVGKSTLLQGIAGKKIHDIEHMTSFSGEVATKSAYDAEDALPAFEIGHSKKSKTNAINALVREVGGNEVVYLDTPGFEDTSGVEMDIATAALLSQVAKRCKSLKFVIIIHCASLIEDRGGAFRSVLRFARAFVQDFERAKMSFMFLFSHTNEITGMSRSLNDARARLQEEILRTAEGTTDQEVLAVLNFIRKSLNKNYPFVQIFHPLAMDYAKLTGQIEAKLTKITDLTLARSANMTVSSKFMLESAVQGLVQRLRVALRESSKDVAEVADVRCMIQSLNKYIDVDCLRHAAVESKAILDEHIKFIQMSVADYVSRGTSLDTEFNQGHILALKQTLMQLSELAGPDSSSCYIESIGRRLLDFSEIIFERACSATAFHMELRKIVVWAEGFVDFAPIYAHVSNRIVNLATDLSNALETDVHNFSTLSDEDILVIIRNLTNLHTICEQVTQFSICCTPEMLTVIMSKDSTMDKIESVFKEWSEAAVVFANECDVLDDTCGMEFLARAARAMQAIRPSLETFFEHSSCHFHRLEDLVITTSNEVENAVIGRFSMYCNEMSQTKFDPCWKPRLFWMQSVCTHFDEMRGAPWKRLGSSIFSIIDSIKTDLHRETGEIYNMCSMVRDHSGMINGESFAKEIIRLDEWKWIDELLPEDQQFLATCCEKVMRMVQQRIDLKRAELGPIIDLDLPINGSSVKYINDIGKIYPELSELDKFSKLMTHYRGYDEITCGLSLMCEKSLEQFVNKLDAIAKVYAAVWASKNASGRIGYMRTISRKLNCVLANIDALLSIGASKIIKRKATRIQSQIDKHFDKFKREFKAEFSSFDGSFSTKNGLLVTVQACRAFHHVECRLIDIKEAKQSVLELFLKEARKIESSIEASSQWDRIDEALLRFEAATVLDRFVGGEGASRLRTLRRLREQKEEQVDDQMTSMIQNHDFKGIGAFLRPLADSKDQLKRQKFDSHRRDIASILKDMIADCDRLLNADATIEINSLSLAKNMIVLSSAKSELQNLLSVDVNLVYEVNSLQRQIHKCFGQITTQLTKALKDKDYIQMITSKRQGLKFLSDMRELLRKWDVETFEKASDKISKELEESVILKCVENFFLSNFKDGESLFNSLNGLKRARGMGGKFPKLASLYDIAKTSLESRIREHAQKSKDFVLDSKCFDDGITYLHSLYRHLQGELKDHCSSELVSRVDRLIQDLRSLKKENDQILQLNGKEYKENLDQLACQLDRLSSSSFFTLWKESKKETYSRLREDLTDQVESRFNQARLALQARDLLSVQGTIDFLELVHKKTGKHVEIVGSRITSIRNQCIDEFCKLCTHATEILSSDNNCMPFKEIFPDFRGFVLHVACVLQSPSGQKSFAHVNQLLSKSLDSSLLSLRLCVDADILDLEGLRSRVMNVRAWGSFAADHLTLLLEELHNLSDHAKLEMTWLRKIHTFCWDHFDVGRDLGKLKYCAILGVLPSASETDIKKAFKENARRHHPDKDKSIDASSKFRTIKEAYEKLLSMRHISTPTDAQPFDELMLGIGQRLRVRAKSFMTDQRYDMVEHLLFELRNIKILDDLVLPKLNSEEISISVVALVKGFVEQSRVEVDSFWTERNYKDLNVVISSLKSMERHFKSYPEIFPKSWDTGISDKIESEINSLGEKASACLQNRVKAEEKQADFRRCFIQMGFVLTELPSFKSFTKSVMSCVLERCLDNPWGYSYLFELGLSLQKGDDASTDDENRVAQMIVNEFSHFKEVLVMVWNEEVLQKPADEVVMHIRGDVYVTPTQTCPITVDHDQLLDSYTMYEREYKSLVAIYIKPDADLTALVHKTLALAHQVAPKSKGDHWGDDLKRAIPLLLAGVFSLLTVVKSGASYNRIEEATGSLEMGEKLLLKPHNIQVLTLLLMLGCGAGQQKSIQNQLMQIRTGEGKSMILGAASVMLALLGFRVRTVCYSEFLSMRDFQLFEDIFDRFGLIDYIKYSKITTFAEDTTAAKGDIRGLTESLLRGKLSPVTASSFDLASSAPIVLTSSSDLVSSGTISNPRGARRAETKSESTQSTSSARQRKKRSQSIDCAFSGIQSEPRRGRRLEASAEAAPLADSAQHQAMRSKSCESSQLKAVISDKQLSNLSSNNVSSSTMAKLRGSKGTTKETEKLDANTCVAGRDCTEEIIEPSSQERALRSAGPTQFAFPMAHAKALEREEILLVDEVDVFFGSEFYGQTYNQVLEFKEPEIEEILKRIWNAWSHGGRRPVLTDIKSMPEYQRLLCKLSSFSFLLDNEISRMLDQVSKVDDVPYHLDLDNDRIGYKVMDSISYDVTYGYCTCFAYLKELSKLKNKAILSKVLVMPVSCGQFSYANISPHRILGVSGTLQALNEHERDILLKYGLNRYIYVPSVYGASNFHFDKAGNGIYFENTRSDFYHRITAEITSAAKEKRSVIVFFQDRSKLDEFVASPMYRQLNRHKKLLLEDMSSTDKSFVISKAATAGQITLSTAVFGHGTDFFGKDEVVEKNGGVHIIQTFLSEELSEEIQIQGRTARQGKQGSYQMVLLEADLQTQYGVDIGDKDKIPQKDVYEWLCNLRLLKQRKRCVLMEKNLKEATLKDCATHRYFDSLLAGNIADAESEFEELYRLMKKAPMPTSLIIDLAFAIDITGSMSPYFSSVTSTIGNLVAGQNSILEKLKSTFPEILFKLRVGCFGFRDVDDKPNQFQDIVWKEGHFTDDIPTAIQGIQSLCGNTYGGADIAEDHIGAIYHCAHDWTHSDDWTSEIKCMILFSDAPSHGLVRPVFSGDSTYDSYSTHHPDGLKLDDAVSSLLSKDISLFFCSFDPHATATTEEEISRCMKEHPDNKSGGGIVLIPMVPKHQVSTSVESFKGHGRHIIFVLDESGSMQGSWSGVVEAYVKYIEKRKQSQSCNDLVSVVQFESSAHVTVSKAALSKAPHQLSYRGGGTRFHPAAVEACKLAHDVPESHTPVIIFMSDGGAESSQDADAAAREFSVLNQRVSAATGNDIELHVIAFGAGACIPQLEAIARASKIGQVHSSANVAGLASVFVSIAANANVATVLESEIAKRMSEAVSDMLSLEYFGS